MTRKGLSAGTMTSWAATMLERARAAVIALALLGILGVLASHLALAMKWTDLFHYSCWVLASLALYALALAIGHVGNAQPLPAPANDWQPAAPRARVRRH